MSEAASAGDDAMWGPLRCAVALVALAPALARAEPVFPPGGGVGLEPPPGMRVADGFLGFQRGFASILITEMPPEAFAQLSGQRAALAARLEDATAADFAAGGASGYVVRGVQRLDGRPFRKWAVVLGGARETALVTAQVPLDDAEIAPAAVEAVLRTIAFRAPPAEAERVAALPFTVGDDAGFRRTGALMGAVLGFTEGPRDVDPEIAQPHVVVAASLGHPAPATDRLAFAEAALRAGRAIRVGRITAARLFEADGVPWARVEGEGAAGKANVPVRAVLYLRFDPSGDFITVMCDAPVSDPADYAGRFERLALSVRPKG